MAALQSFEGDTLARLIPGIDLLSLTIGMIIKLAANIWETRLGLLYASRREDLKSYLRRILPRYVDMAVEYVLAAPSSAQSLVALPLALQTQSSTASSTPSPSSSNASSGSSSSSSSSLSSSSITSLNPPHSSESLHVTRSELEPSTQQHPIVIPAVSQASPVEAPANDAPQATGVTSTVPANSPPSTTRAALSTPLPHLALVPLPHMESMSPLLGTSTSSATDDAAAAAPSNFAPPPTSPPPGTTSFSLAPAAPVRELPYFLERLLYGSVGELTLPPDVMSRKLEWEELVINTSGITDFQLILDILATSPTGRCTSIIPSRYLASMRDG